MKRVKIDDTNIAIIQRLQDGRKSYKKIAEELSITENTVRTRVLKMIEEGILQITGLVDPEALPGHKAVMIGVKLQTSDLVAKGEEFSQLRGVVSVGVVTGRYDLIMTVHLRDDFDLLEFFADEMTKVGDVLSVETFVVYKGFNIRVPYMV